VRRGPLAAVAAALFLALTGAAEAAGGMFTVVEGEAPLPSAEVRNAPGDVAFPAAISTPPASPQVLSYGELLALWRQAGDAYGIPWEVLAAINEVESGFGSNMGPSYAGAVGWMQFLPSTWEAWGLDATGDGVADPWDPTDAVFSAARYLAATGAREDLPGAVWSYNHSDAYVAHVLDLAGQFLMNPLRGHQLPFAPQGTDSGAAPLQALLADARGRAQGLATEASEIQAAIAEGESALLEAEASTGNPELSDAEFEQVRTKLDSLASRRVSLDAELTQTLTDLAHTEEQIAAIEQAVAAEESTLGTTGLDGLIGRPPTPAAARVIEWAIQQLGIPYQWGGNHGFSLEQMVAQDPAIPAGFDCSSLLSWAYAKGAGIYIGDYTGTQWERGATTPGAERGAGPAQGGGPPPGGYMAGDLIFFNATGHVAMYLGNGLFVHAPHTGDVVRVARLADYPLEVWGWVRYQDVSGLVFGAPAEAAEPVSDERVFSVLPAENGEVISFSRA
jgi:cell wall-associated NlpC family hydrolase